jgi:hypothetical protein
MALIWKGTQVYEDVAAALVDGITEFGLTHETEAKRELLPGRGVLTGTLRRSIHAASPDYQFGDDDLPPTPSSPERGGQGLDVQPQKDRIAVTVGSGMAYARYIKQLYGYITQSHGRVIDKLPGIIRKHAARRGLL